MSKTEQALGILQAIRALAQVKTNSDTNAKTIWSIKAVADAGISALESAKVEIQIGGSKLANES